MSATKFKLNVSTIINKNGLVLIQKRAIDEEVFPGLFGIPGGTVESSDKDLIEALKREVMEEVGVEITNVRLLQNNIITKPDKSTLYMVFTSDYESGTIKAMDGTESVQWSNMEEIKELEFTPTTKELLIDYYGKNRKDSLGRH